MLCSCSDQELWQCRYAKNVCGKNSRRNGPDNTALRGEVKVDVCVIGAGFTGLSAALHLLEKGKSVCVLEAHRAGHGGSGRNVGLVNAGMWIPPDEIEAGFGEAVGSQLNRMLGAAPALVFSLVDKYNIDCQLRREGTLHMAHNAKGEADLRSREAAMETSWCAGRIAHRQGLRTSHRYAKDCRRIARSPRRHAQPDGLCHRSGQRCEAVWAGRCSITRRSPALNARARNGRCRPSRVRCSPSKW